MVNWSEVARQFPINEHYTWLNACGTSPSGTPMVEAVTRYMRAYAEHGILAPGYSYVETRRAIQTILAGLLNCRPHEVALVQNTAEAMNFVSLGLDLRAGERILLLEKEYPSNVYPWQRWARHGVDLVTVPLAESPERFLENFERAAAVPGTRVAALSAVHWCTGMRMPIDEIADLCSRRGIMLVLDVAQAAGHVPVDLARWNACAAFSAWKWLLGPVGLGVLVVPDTWISRLDPVVKGTESVVNDEKYLPYRDELKPSAERYMVSTGAFLQWVYFRAALELLEGLGFDAVRARIMALADHLRAGLRAAGLEVAEYGPNGASGIVTAWGSGFDAAAAARSLHRHGIIARERDGRLRLAAHVLISEAQLDRAATAVGAERRP